MTPLKILLLVTLLAFIPMGGVHAQQNASDPRIAMLQNEVNQLKLSTTDAASNGIVLFLFGAFCALWAQNTRRSAWLWFFLGIIFNIVAILVLLFKNAADKRPPNPRLFSEGRRIGTPLRPR